MRSTWLSVLLLMSAAAPAAAQSRWSATLGGGYTNANGYDVAWDEGRVLHLRSAVWRRLGARLDLGVEGGAYLFGTDRDVFTCGGGTGCGNQTFTTVNERRSWAWTADLALRWRMGGRTVRPHATFGLGVGERRDRTRVRYQDAETRTESDHPTSTSLLPVGAIGVGLEIAPPGSRLALTTGIRGDFAFDAYDGTPSAARLLSATVGISIR